MRNNVTEEYKADPKTAPLYVMEGRVFNSGAADSVRDLNAASGWGGAGYTAPRAAAPFAILDTIYKGMQRILRIDPKFKFEPLPIFWNTDNRPAECEDEEKNCKAKGEIGTSHVAGGKEMYILGKEDVDIDEYDEGVMLHEWGHYFEHFAARADSIGGPHGHADNLDMRVAFGEGFGNAFSSMLRDDPRYFDISGPRQAQGMVFYVSELKDPKAWYGEGAVQYAFYQLYVADSIGLPKIYETLVSDEYKKGPAFTSLFSFAAELRKRLSPTGRGRLDQILSQLNMVRGADLDAYGTNQNTLPPDIDSGDKALVLPIYTRV